MPSAALGTSHQPKLQGMMIVSRNTRGWVGRLCNFGLKLRCCSSCKQFPRVCGSHTWACNTQIYEAKELCIAGTA